MNVGTMVAVLFYVYNNKPVALKKKKWIVFFLVYCYIHNKLAGLYCP